MVSAISHFTNKFKYTSPHFARTISSSAFQQRTFASKQEFSGGSVHIPKIVRENLEGAFGLCDRNPYSAANFHHLSRQAGFTIRANLPADVRVALESVLRSDRSYVSITGIPRDRHLPPTPASADHISSLKKTSISELFIMGLADLFDQKMFGYRQYALTCPHLIQNEFPKMDVGGPNRPPHRFHMDHAWHPQFPATLIRSGLRSNPRSPIKTRVVANNSIIRELTPAQADVLRQNPFIVFPETIHAEMESAHDLPFSHQRPYIGPVLIEEDDGKTLRFNSGRISPAEKDSFAFETLAQVETLAQEHAETVELNEDTCLVVNNRRALVTGDEFDDTNPDPQNWVQSARLIEETRLWRQLPVLDTDFPFLTADEFSLLSRHLNTLRLMNGRMLTYKFRPHEKTFSLKLHESLIPHERKILEVLLGYGPAYPSRFI